MPRIRRLHRLESTELEHVHANLRLMHESINTLYTLVDQRFGVSDKRALRLQALKRKLAEVDGLFTETSSSGSATTM